ncbi:hypothetical protein F5884DRAFT_870081 [Xylogone sp. PMI_703]|nr:hypothetical protein F5884DRAFT_870081 [Xylogone sp. PMI_703]
MSSSQDSFLFITPTTLSVPNYSPPATSVAASSPSVAASAPSIVSIAAEKPSIWTFFRHSRGSEPEFKSKERLDRSGKSSNKCLHYCIACWENEKKSWSTIYTSGARDHLRLNHPSLWRKWLGVEGRPHSSKAEFMQGQQSMTSFMRQKDEASRELIL